MGEFFNRQPLFRLLGIHLKKPPSEFLLPCGSSREVGTTLAQLWMDRDAAAPDAKRACLARGDSGVKDQRGFTEPEHVEAGVAIATPDGNKKQE